MDINKPSKYNFDLTINVFARDKAGIDYKLIIHTEKDINETSNIFLDYKDHIMKGDIVELKTKQALEEDFGIKRISDLEFFESPIEDMDDDEIDAFDYSINVIVDYLPEITGKLGECFVSWIEISDEDIVEEHDFQY